MIISRYEEKSNELFICLNSETKPVYSEHFFDVSERETEETRKATIERLAGELQVKEDEYVEPEQAVSKVEEARAFKLDTVKIQEAKDKFIADRLNNQYE